MQGGEVTADGGVHDIISRYLTPRDEQPAVVQLAARARPEYIQPRRARIQNISPAVNRPLPWFLPFGDPLSFRVSVKVLSPLEKLDFCYGIFTTMNYEVVASFGRLDLHCKTGEHRFQVNVLNTRLVPGRYSVGVSLRSSEGDEDYLPEAFSFEIGSNSISAMMRLDRVGARCIPETQIVLESPSRVGPEGRS